MGGAERMVLHLVRNLPRDRFEPFVCSTVGGGELIELAQPVCGAVAHLRFANPLDPAGMWRLARFIRANRIDVVQIHGLRAEIPGRVVARLAGVRRVISTIHSVDPWRRAVHSLADRATRLLVSAHVAVCRAALEAAQARGEVSPHGPAHVIPIGVPLPSDVPPGEAAAMRASLGVAADAFPVVGVLANLRDMKGHAEMIRAAASLRGRFPRMRIVCAGNDTSGGAVPAMARAQGVDDTVLFPGFVRDTAALLAGLDVFALPSHWEGLPVSIIEAMHAGRPVVATRVGGVPELIKDGVDGLLVAPRDAGALASAIAALADDPVLRDRLGAAARARARAEFSVERMVERHARLYDSLA
jgi:glycosyltransferase involved in cell wall biosynthesis